MLVFVYNKNQYYIIGIYTFYSSDKIIKMQFIQKYFFTRFKKFKQMIALLVEKPISSCLILNIKLYKANRENLVNSGVVDLQYFSDHFSGALKA
jgi:hypothetical protein